MPSVSPKQARLMAAAAYTPGGYGGVPQSVGKDFNQADKGPGILSKQKAAAGGIITKPPIASSSEAERRAIGGSLFKEAKGK